ncbi:MAG: hypothetical protein PVH03_03875 [Chloroflexota bacterium]|jgi:hypothetical protein
MNTYKKIAETLEGYGRANEFLEQERMERLSQLTPEESRAIFSELVDQGQKTLVTDNQSDLMLSWRLETLISVRQAIKKLAQVKGWM